MANQLEHMLERIAELRTEVENELARRRERFRYRLERGRVVFESEVRQRHRAARIPLRRFLANTRPLVVLSAPVIYGLIVPLALLDLCLTIYQAICFPIYGIARVRRGDHIIVDRHRLEYLNALQKLNCVYCGYGNGVISYAREIAARTEQYWCPIKHAHGIPDMHDRYPEFADFGDAEAFERRLDALRARLAREREAQDGRGGTDAGG